MTQSSDDGAAEAAVSGLSELARQRREAAEEDAARPAPAFIRTVDQSEVSYTFLPEAVPFHQIDVRKLSNELNKMFGVDLEGPDFSPLMSNFSPEQLMHMPEEELFKRLVRARGANPVPILTWAYGRFPLRDDFVAIRSISLNFEAVHVSVSGRSEVAEVVAKETLELVWRLAGARRNFSDLEQHLLLTAYGTATRVDLGYGPEIFLNPQLVGFFDKQLSDGKEFAAQMGRVRRSDVLPASIQAVAALDDLDLLIRKFNPATGATEASSIKFSVTGATDYRTGRMRVSSELPYDLHVELLVDLLATLKAG